MFSLPNVPALAVACSDAATFFVLVNYGPGRDPVYIYSSQFSLFFRTSFVEFHDQFE